MTLIKSISGIRGTIGGKSGEGLTPNDVVKYAKAFSLFLKEKYNKDKVSVVVGRDARISGEMVNRLVTGTLLSMGVDVTDAGLSTTPTVEMAVTQSKADGGIIITASHNPANWNALKLLNNCGEFLSDADGSQILLLADQDVDFSTIDKIGTYSTDESFLDQHIKLILELPEVDVKAIRDFGFKVVIDSVNSTGGIAIPKLMNALGVKEYECVFCEPNGRFAHNPEPLPDNLVEISSRIQKSGAHVGFAVDPDVDRLAIVDENGEMFGEEYTLVAVADYILQHKKGAAVSNLSSTRALKKICDKHKVEYHASAVGEVNVVAKMKEVGAVIGGEGNGGVIFPDLHYGRDALLGIALFLSHLAKFGKSCSSLRSNYPDFHISKNKIELSPEMDTGKILEEVRTRYSNHPVNTIDGVKIEFDDQWVHLRKSNTEPIIRIYAESDSSRKANHLAQKIINDIREIIQEEN